MFAEGICDLEIEATGFFGNGVGMGQAGDSVDVLLAVGEKEQGEYPHEGTVSVAEPVFFPAVLPWLALLIGLYGGLCGDAHIEYFAVGGEVCLIEPSDKILHDVLWLDTSTTAEAFEGGKGHGAII